MSIPVEEYRDRIVFNWKPDGTDVAFFHYWGAVGDFYYYLTLIGPLLRRFQLRKRVLLADLYDRYSGKPVHDLCLMNCDVDEIWYHRREPGLSPVPSEVQGPGVEYYAHDHRHMCVPGAAELPRLSLEEKEIRKKRLIGLIREEKVRSVLAPELGGDPFITLGAVSQHKRADSALPIRFLKALPGLGIRVVVLRFPGHDAGESLFSECGFTIVDVLGPIESLSVQALAAAHVGVEDSQMLGAAIHGVPTLYFPFRPTGAKVMAYLDDLGITDWCYKMDWEADPEDFLDRLKKVLKWCDLKGR